MGRFCCAVAVIDDDDDNDEGRIRLLRLGVKEEAEENYEEERN